jgi:hypothetical protein
MTQVTQTGRRGAAQERNRRPGRTRAGARHTRMRVSSDLVVSAYIQELADSAVAATPVMNGGSRLAGPAPSAGIRGRALEPA